MRFGWVDLCLRENKDFKKYITLVNNIIKEVHQYADIMLFSLADYRFVYLLYICL